MKAVFFFLFDMLAMARPFNSQMPKHWNITNLSMQVTSMPIISFEQLAFVAYSVSLLEDLSCEAVLVVAELVDPNTHNNKLATYHSWFAIPFSRNERMPIYVPRYLHLDLSKHVMRNISRFRLRAHTLKVEAAAWLAYVTNVLVKMVLAYVTNVLVKMNMFRTSRMLFYFAKTIEFVS